MLLLLLLLLVVVLVIMVVGWWVRVGCRGVLLLVVLLRLWILSLLCKLLLWVLPLLWVLLLRVLLLRVLPLLWVLLLLRVLLLRLGLLRSLTTPAEQAQELDHDARHGDRPLWRVDISVDRRAETHTVKSRLDINKQKVRKTISRIIPPTWTSRVALVPFT